MIKEYEFKDDRGQDGDYLAVQIEFVENHTEKHYVQTFQKELTEDFPKFLSDYYVCIKFAKFFPGTIKDQDHLFSPIKIKFC